MSNITLRKFQQEALQSLYQNDHTILIAPTGSGKSLIFQKYLEQNKNSVRAVFISPLNALARQQQMRLEAFGVKSTLGIGGGEKIAPDGSGVWILNPESINGRLKSELEFWRPNLLIVDEAHCISEWGDSFRPQFKSILNLVERYKIQKSFWCSATLPVLAQNEIKAALPGKVQVMGTFKLAPQLEVHKIKIMPHARLDKLRQILGHHAHQSGIIFTPTRQSTTRIGNFLQLWGVSSVSYHAGLSREERTALEKLIQNSEFPMVVVATSAFGMGMDYPFLKFCVLFEPAFNLLSLTQSIGRVGRGEESAQVYALWHPSDFERSRWVTRGSVQALKELRLVRDWYESDSHAQIDGEVGEGGFTLSASDALFEKPNDANPAFLEKYFNDLPNSGRIYEDDEHF